MARIFLLSILLVPTTLRAQQPAIDGIFNEWKPAHQIATDPVGDATGAFDIKSVSAITKGNVLYLRLQLDRAVNLQNGPDEDGTLQLFLSAVCRGFWKIDFRARTATLGRDLPLSWDEIGFQCLPTFASKEYEMRIDLSSSRSITSNGSGVWKFQGSDLLQPFATFFLQKSEPISAAQQDWTKRSGSFRVVNQNTLSNGLSDPERGPKFKRLFNAINSDVYCFQEEWDQEKFHQGAAATLRPGTFLIWNGGCAIATQHQLSPLEMELDQAIAGLVTTYDGRRVVVISAHFKCCGYAGSNEDDLRIQQAEQLVGELKRLREGAFGEGIKDAPVVLIGDYNLVGSRKPLDIINAAGLNDVVCTADDGSAHTWRGLKSDESFWPGRLDLVSTTGFGTVTGRVFDTGRIWDTGLQQLGVEGEDSTASDHLMLVVDCEGSK